MYEGILGLHSILRWALIIFLIVNIIRVNVEAGEHFDVLDRKWSLRLLITTHLNLLAAIYLYFFGNHGIIRILYKDNYPFEIVMKTSNLRFWVIEHPIMMLTSIILITISHSFSKKNIEPLKKHKIMSILYILALIIILVAIPWPFREVGMGIPYFRALY